MVTDGARITVHALSSVERLVGAAIGSLACIDRACISIITHIFIDHAIAIIIDSIACFDAWRRSVTRVKSGLRAQSDSGATPDVIGCGAR